MTKTVFSDTAPAGTIVTAAFLNALNNHRHTGRDIDGDGAKDYAVSTGSANAYLLALSPALDALIDGMPILFKANFTNTGAATLKVNDTDAKPLKKNFNQALAANDIQSGQVVLAIYNGTNYQIVDVGVELILGTAFQEMGMNSGGTAQECFDGVRKLLDATGKIPYASAANVIAALAIGSANKHFLVNAAGTLPEWAIPFKMATFTRAGDAESGDAAYTGLGFKPAAMIFFAVHEKTQYQPITFGLTDFVKDGALLNYGSYNFMVDNYLMAVGVSVETLQKAVHKTADADGFTLTWTKVGSPNSATITFIVMAFR